MIPINSTYAPIQVLVDELARFGMAHAVTCPGSRNAPIALALAEHPEIEAISVVDERSAGFVALGIAKELGGELPVAVTCTSGTAAANLMPAVVEAHEAAIPLIVLTADRPPELREIGAGQAIDQIKLYGNFVKWFVEVGNLPAGRASAVHHRQLGSRAAAVATSVRPGPVHLNFPLREPLAPVREELDPADWEGREEGAPWTDLGWVASDTPYRSSAATADGGDDDLRDLLADTGRGLVVCGGGDPSMTPAAVQLGSQLGWPVLAEPTSGARSWPELQPDPIIAHYDLSLRSETFAAERPDLVVRVGEMPTSKPLRAWLEGCRQVIVDAHLDWHDPTRVAESIWPLDGDALHASIPDADRGGSAGAGRRSGDAGLGASGSGGGPSPWLERWTGADTIVAEELASTEEPFEALAYNALAETAETVFVSSSLPIRDVESYFPRTHRPIRILSNRGANGIDGVVSTATGVAIATEAPVHLIVGELALLHDVGGLVTARRAGAELAILCVNNGGGAIFDFLPVAQHAASDDYEGHIATPVPFDLGAAAALGGLSHHVVHDAAGVRQFLQPGALVELRVDREESLAKHRELAARVVARLDGWAESDLAARLDG